MNQRGFTPFPIVFGSRMNRQDIENELMNAKTTNSEMVKAHWHAIAKSKQAFIQSENNIRLKKIEKQNQTKFDSSIKRGDIVQYFRKSLNKKQ